MSVREALLAEADRIARRARDLGDEGELYCYLSGKVQGLLDAANIVEGIGA